MRRLGKRLIYKSPTVRLIVNRKLYKYVADFIDMDFYVYYIFHTRGMD